MAEQQRIPWKRVAVEATAIVVSILLAFAIDAWWDDRKEQSADREQLARVSLELRANAALIEQKLGTVATAIQATSMFLSWMGPEPEPVPPEVFFEQWTTLYSIGTFALVRSAADDFLAAGQVGLIRNENIRHAISSWYSDADHLESQYDLLRVAHADVGERLREIVPMFHADRKNTVMEGHPESRFPFEQTIALADPQTESRLGVYLIRMEFFTAEAKELMERQETIFDLIGPSAAE
jgi:hypothetical protein